MFSARGLLIATGVCVLSGLFELARSYRLVRAGKRARARLMPSKAREGDEDDATPPLTLHFETEDGLPIELRESTRNRSDDAAIGTVVTVLYDPQNPRSARRDAFAQLWSPGLVWLAFGLILATLAIVHVLLPSA